MKTRLFPLWMLLFAAACSGLDSGEDSGGDSVETGAIDADRDGVPLDLDCDDSDPLLGSRELDADCDGHLADVDCDDTSTERGSQSEDEDCDGDLTEDDCDDTRPELNHKDEDGDGYSTCDGDCDDKLIGFNPGAVDTRISDRDCSGGVAPGTMSSAEYKLIGEFDYDWAGRVVASAGDVDGDGLGDILVGTPRQDDGGNAVGAAYLVLGKSLAEERDMDLGRADCKFLGEEPGDWAGRWVSSAGDVDGDGLDDLLIGAYLNDAAGEDAGAVYVVLGSSLGSRRRFLLSEADYVLLGEAAGDGAGRSVSSAGDVDGDGLADLLVGAYRNDGGAENAGAAYVILGASLGPTRVLSLADSDHIFRGELAEDWAGFSVSGAGDLDGDGLDDIAIGAPTGHQPKPGLAYVFRGSSLSGETERSLLEADYRLSGENAGDWAGYSLAPAGDVDGDGRGDLLVGVPTQPPGTQDDRAYLVLGSSFEGEREIALEDTDFKLKGELGYNWAGYSVSSAGDVDGDGLSDILIGSPASLNVKDFGAAYLLLGKSLVDPGTIILSKSDRKVVTAYSYDYAGRSVAGIGDVDGDGLDDVVVSAYRDRDGGIRAGAVYVFVTGGNTR